MMNISYNVCSWIDAKIIVQVEVALLCTNICRLGIVTKPKILKNELWRWSYYTSLEWSRLDIVFDPQTEIIVFQIVTQVMTNINLLMSRIPGIDGNWIFCMLVCNSKITKGILWGLLPSTYNSAISSQLMSRMVIVHL